MKKVTYSFICVLLFYPFICNADSSAQCNKLDGFTIDTSDITAPIQTTDEDMCCDFCASYSGCEAAVIDGRMFCHLKNSTNTTPKKMSIVLVELPSPTTTTPPLPPQNWNASTGIYNDTTNQPGRYSNDVSGVVVDNFSNLQWEQKNSTSRMSWQEANNYCANRTTGGYTDWRLPQIHELQSLVDYTTNSPAINSNFFPGTYQGDFWSSIPVAGSTHAGYFWSTGYMYGDVSGSKTAGDVRCVRSGSLPPITNRYDYTSIPGVVKDLLTGLSWERNTQGRSVVNWNNALSYCHSVSTGGLSGWRLPTIKELATLVNRKIVPYSGSATMDPAAFPNEPAEDYWSSSAVSGYSVVAWFVNFYFGSVYYSGLSSSNYVRCVVSEPF